MNPLKNFVARPTPTLEQFIEDFRVSNEFLKQMTDEQKSKIDPSVLNLYDAWLSYSPEDQQSSMKQMMLTGASAQEAYQAMSNGFPCDQHGCNGIMYWAMERSLCYDPNRQMMCDQYVLKCDKCSHNDVFLQYLPHLDEEAKRQHTEGKTGYAKLTTAKYEDVRAKGQMGGWTPTDVRVDIDKGNQ